MLIFYLQGFDVERSSSESDFGESDPQCKSSESDPNTPSSSSEDTYHGPHADQADRPDSATDSDFDDECSVFPISIEAADEVCVKLDTLVRNGTLSKEGILYKHIRDVVNQLHDPKHHQYDKEVIEFYNSIRYLGGESTVNPLRGPYEDVCEQCKEKGQVSHYLASRACTKCLEEGKECIKLAAFVFTRDCEKGNKKAMETIN